MKKAFYAIIGWLLACSIIAAPALYAGIKYGKPIVSMYYNTYQLGKAADEIKFGTNTKLVFSFPSDPEHKGVNKMKEMLSDEPNYGGVVPLANNLNGYMAVCSKEPQIRYLEMKSDVEHTPWFNAFIDNSDKVYGYRACIYFNELSANGYITITEGRAVDATAAYSEDKPAEIIVPDSCDIALGTTVYINLGILNDDNYEFFIKATVVGKAHVNERLPLLGSVYHMVSYFDGSFQNNSETVFISDVSSVYNVFHKSIFDIDNSNAEMYFLSYKDPSKEGISDSKIIDAANASGGCIFSDYQKLLSPASMIEIRLQKPIIILTVISLLAGIFAVVLFVVQTLKILLRYKKQKQRE